MLKGGLRAGKGEKGAHFRECVLEKKQKNRIIIALNKNNILVQKIKAFLNYTKLVNANSYSSLNKLGEVGLYGSYKRGTDDKDSDVDLFILTDKKELEIQPIIRKLEKEIQRKVNFITLTKNKIKNIKEKDPEFYIRLKLTSTGGEIFEY